MRDEDFFARDLVCCRPGEKCLSFAFPIVQDGYIWIAFSVPKQRVDMRFSRQLMLIGLFGGLGIFAEAQFWGGQGQNPPPLPVSGSDSVTLTTPSAGNGLWWLNGVGTFSGTNDEPIGGSSYEFRADLYVTGPDENGSSHSYLDMGPSKTTLVPQASVSNWILDGSYIVTSGTSGTYEAYVSLSAVKLPADPTLPALLFIDGDTATATIP